MSNCTKVGLICNVQMGLEVGGPEIEAAMAHGFVISYNSMEAAHRG